MKVTIVGDGAVGKTCLIASFVENRFPEEYIPTVFDELTFSYKTSRQKIHHLTIWDTAGQEGFDRLRCLSYPNTDVFLLCYAVDNRISFDNIYTRWIPELRHHNPYTPIVLVATKLDLFVPKSRKFVTANEGTKMSKKIKSFAFVECSALTQRNLQAIFEEAIRAVEDKQQHQYIPRSRICGIL